MRTDSSPRCFAQSLLDQAETRLHERQIASLHARLGDWFTTAEYLGRVVDELGSAFEENERRVVQEHLVSSRLSMALANVSARFAIPADAPTALLATLAGEPHVLGLSIAQLCLRSMRFDTLWLGAGIPTGELVSFIRDSDIAVVALSASEYSTDRAALEAAYRDTASACSDRGAVLLLGGRGAWPESVDYGYRCRTFLEMRDILS